MRDINHDCVLIVTSVIIPIRCSVASFIGHTGGSGSPESLSCTTNGTAYRETTLTIQLTSHTYPLDCCTEHFLLLLTNIRVNIKTSLSSNWNPSARFSERLRVCKDGIRRLYHKLMRGCTNVSVYNCLIMFRFGKRGTPKEGQLKAHARQSNCFTWGQQP
jgi:hypothetical protein